MWTAIGRQLRHPRGPIGRVAGRLMRVVNREPYVAAIAALRLQPTDCVLELGCGPGEGVRLMARQVACGTVHAIDHSATTLAQARARNREAIRTGRVRLYRGSCEQLPFADSSVDKVLAVNVAYFWDDCRAVLREVRRVLRPGGVLAIYVTDAATMRRWRFVDAETHRVFDRETLASALECAGFDEAVSVGNVPMAARIIGLVATAR